MQKDFARESGIDGSLTYQPAGGEKVKSDKAMPTHTEAIQFVIDALTDAETGVVKSLDEIGGSRTSCRTWWRESLQKSLL